jgi:uncharacterized protein YdaL
MKKLLHILSVTLALTIILALQPASAQTVPKTLIIYDAPPNTEFSKLSLAYGIMLKNLMAHFDATVQLQDVESYTTGQVEAYDAVFYLGGYYNNTLPPAFVADIYNTQKTVVWFKYNLWQLAWDPAYNFATKFGFNFASLRGMNAIPTAANPAPGFFDTITYKTKPFVKYYSFDSAAGAINADPEFGVTTITDPTKATALVSASNPKTAETAPYVTRSGNFWYVADLPFSYIGPRDRYLVLTDLLHDILGINHPESHKAMVRLEDVGALVTVASMKSLTDYLYQKKIPFSIAVIPHYVDALGVYNGGIPMTVPLSQATNLKRAINYALPRGGEVVMHGYTHQYSNMRNRHTGVSGDDYEFWNIVANTPVVEDSTAWALGRLNAGIQELKSNGYNPVAWETPHYHASALSSKAVPLVFNTTYQRVVYFTADQPNFNAGVGKDFAVGQIFPYVIKRDHYGQRVLPENLGNIEYDISNIDPTSNFNYTWQDILINAQYAKTVRDGYASFFFHPFWLEPVVGKPGLADFKSLITGITALGYTWTVPSKILP